MDCELQGAQDKYATSSRGTGVQKRKRDTEIYSDQYAGTEGLFMWW